MVQGTTQGWYVILGLEERADNHYKAVGVSLPSEDLAQRRAELDVLIKQQLEQLNGQYVKESPEYYQARDKAIGRLVAEVHTIDRQGTIESKLLEKVYKQQSYAIGQILNR